MCIWLDFYFYFLDVHMFFINRSMRWNPGGELLYIKTGVPGHRVIKKERGHLNFITVKYFRGRIEHFKGKCFGGRGRGSKTKFLTYKI